jgi:hypothetical protein
MIIVQRETLKRERMISLPLGKDGLPVAPRNPNLHTHASPNFGEQGLYTCGLPDRCCSDSDFGLCFGLGRHRYRYIFGRTANTGCE